MNIRNSVIALAPLMGILVNSAMGFIDQPVFVPNVIRGDELFRVFYRNGVCDFFPSAGFPIDVVRVPPNRIQLFVTGIHQTDFILCVAPVINPSIDIPALPAGDYQLELYIRNRANPLIPIHNGPVTQFTVVGNPNVATIPTLNVGGLLTLTLGFLGLAWLTRRS
jgi:hypothetical protein